MLKTYYNISFKNILLFGLACSLWACEPIATEKDANFDTKAMLSNIGLNLILPGYQQLETDLQVLKTELESFNNDPSKLSAIQSQFIQTYSTWVSVSMYELGPAEDLNLRLSSNAFPADSSQIKANIQAASYNLNAASNIDAKGFPALDYLLFNPSVSLQDSATYAYTLVVLNRLLNDARVLNEVWNEGNYLNTFIEKNTVDLGGSIGKLVNQFNLDLEISKNFRMAIPMGKKNPTGDVLINQMEAQGSQQSLQLLIKNIEASKNLFLGNGKGGDGLGFDDYLNALHHEGEADISANIIAQYDKVLNDLYAISSDYESALNQRDASLGNAYTNIQFLVQLTKTSMASKLGVMIAYQDGDGD